MQAERTIVERRRPWTVPGVDAAGDDPDRCICHQGSRCAYCSLREWRAERDARKESCL